MKNVTKRMVELNLKMQMTMKLQMSFANYVQDEHDSGTVNKIQIINNFDDFLIDDRCINLITN
jgi:hypothetical protein